MLSLPTLLLLASVVRSVTAACYTPDGSIRDKKNGNNFQPCGETGMCCNIAFGDVCQSNGLCYNPGAKLLWRESCTDPTWESPGCLKLCLDGKMNTDAVVMECENESFCCGSGDSAKKCCKDGTGSFIVDGKVISALPSKSTDAPAAPKSSGKPGAASNTGSSEDDDDDDDDSEPSSSSSSDEDADSTSRSKSKPDSDTESSSPESSSDNGALSGGSSGAGPDAGASGSDSGSSEAGSGSSTNVGAIAGGVVGGVAGLALIGLAFILYRRKQRASERGLLVSDYSYKKAAEADGSEIPVEIYTPAPVYELQGSTHGR